jgi:dipeptidase D
MKTITQLSPEPVWHYFSEILRIPRPSKAEEQIIAYLINFADQHGLAVKKDDAGNVLISKPATPGKAHWPAVVLQTHMDMVCEKNSDKAFDFSKDPIVAVAGDKWVTTDGTTLGADNGIGIAMQMAVLASESLQTGPIECLFTVDEETGLTGANALQPGFISGKLLINLDSEDEGEIFIGCAGGMDTVATFNYTEQPVPEHSAALELKIGGLVGGHSGDDIHKGLANANKILVRFLVAQSKKRPVFLSEIDGGNLRNAIARESKAIVVIHEQEISGFLSDLEQYTSDIRFEFEKTEPDLLITCSPVSLPASVMDEPSFNRLLLALMACPHGVLEWSARMPGMVETSTNLASVKMKENQKIVVSTSQRSEIESRKIMAAGTVESVFQLAGADVRHSDGYPGWAPNPDSPLLKLAVASYRKLFKTEPVVRSIHAGLECGLFLEKYPELDMISIGPTIKGAHSPSERIEIVTVEKFRDHLVDILENLLPLASANGNNSKYDRRS